MNYPKNRGGQYIIPAGTDITDLEPGTFVIEGNGDGADTTPFVEENASNPAEATPEATPEAAPEAETDAQAEGESTPEAAA